MRRGSDDQATGNECVACGLLVDRGDSVWLDDGRLAHLSCFRIAAEIIFSGKYDGMTGEEVVALVKMRALKQRNPDAQS